MNFSVDALTPREWDDFVTTETAGHFMQSFGWGQFQQSLGWTPHYCSGQVDGQTHITALLLSRRLPGIPFALFQVPRGPNISSDGAAHLADFGEALRMHVRKHRGVLCRADPYWRDGEPIGTHMATLGFDHLSDEWSFWNAPRFVLWLDLDRSLDTVFDGMEKTCRNEVRSGYKKDVEFMIGGDEDLPDFHRLLASMSHAKGIAVRDLDYFTRLTRSLNASAEVGLFIAKFEGKTISVGMSVRYGRIAWLLYAASDRDYYKVRINRNVQWEMIKWAHERGCARYDFRGSATGDPPAKSDPGYGVYEFKKSFGADFTRLCGYFDMQRTGMLYKLSRAAELRGVPLAYAAKVKLARIRDRGVQTPPG